MKKKLNQNMLINVFIIQGHRSDSDDDEKEAQVHEKFDC